MNCFFFKCDKRGTNITRMVVDSRFNHLFASDNYGYIYHYTIEKYATNGPESNPPTRNQQIGKNKSLHLIFLFSFKMLESTCSGCYFA